MSLQVTGRVVKKMPVQNGESARGPWKKQEVIIETNEQYPKKIAISCWGERVDEIARYQEGDVLTAHISIESREYNDRWYTDVRAWRLEAFGSTPPPSAPTNPPSNSSTPPAEQPTEQASGNDEDDLPF
jgi:hypothetical protein